jgi:hypothetical protein
MILRDFGKRSGHKVPPVSIGAMRLPKDLDAAVELLRAAIDRGMRYIDTSRGYPDSEWVVGRALKGGYRKKVFLSTKWCPWGMKFIPADDSSAGCVRRHIEEQMKRLDVDYLDYYQVWSVNSRENYNQAVARGGMVEGILKAKKEGLVRHTGFTTHDSVESLLKYIKKADWCDILLTSYNLLNTKYAPVIEAARSVGIGTVVMNPVGGGALAKSSPILAALAREVGAVSTADLAVRYVLSNPDIDTMLCGINKLSDVSDSISSVERGAFSPGQLKKINRCLEEIRKQASSFCTGCKYCMPCPEGIDIPFVMNCILDARYWGFEESARERYRNFKGKKADSCVKCGKCEKKCTQHLKIIKEMASAVKMFGKT